MVMEKTPSEEMAADIFTKAFPDSKAHVWKQDLNMIKVIDPATFWSAPPATTPIENATGGECTKFAGKAAAATDDDASTTCSDEH